MTYRAEAPGACWYPLLPVRLCSHQWFPRARSRPCAILSRIRGHASRLLSDDRAHLVRIIRETQYGGRRMPWYPAGVACDDCPNPSRNLVQACLWGRVKRVVFEPTLASTYLVRVYGPLFQGL